MYKYYLFSLLLFVFFSCSDKAEKSGGNEVVIFSAGSLAVPLSKMAKQFEKENPGIKVKIEFSGSRSAARKISELQKTCDIIASADYTVIENLLMPEYVEWIIPFASNEMALAYRLQSAYANEINTDNWLQILQRENVHFGRSEPDSDPCGYRTVLTLKLAEKYYHRKGIAEQLLQKDKAFIRPKETDLLALLESGSIDYIFIYKSIIKQHHLKALYLPDSINLKSTSLASYYRTVSVEVSGKRPGEKIRKTGAPMVYGVAMTKAAPHRKAALLFLQYMLGEKGQIVMDVSGQTSMIPASTVYFEKIPDILKPFARPKQSL